MVVAGTRRSSSASMRGRNRTPAESGRRLCCWALPSRLRNRDRITRFMGSFLCSRTGWWRARATRRARRRRGLLIDSRQHVLIEGEAETAGHEFNAERRGRAANLVSGNRPTAREPRCPRVAGRCRTRRGSLRSWHPLLAWAYLTDRSHSVRYATRDEKRVSGLHFDVNVPAQALDSA